MLVATQALKVEALGASRGNRTLFDNINITLKAGALLQITGDNGSGKSTLLRTITGLLPVQQGSVFWCGQSIHAHRAVFQNALFYLGHQLGLKGAFSASENLSLDPVYVVFQPSAREKALSALGLEDVASVACYQLSRGQQQRLALAKFYLSQAKIFILDEPFSGLDKSMMATVQHIMLDKLSHGASIVLTSHQALTLSDLTDSVSTLSLGEG